MLTARGSSSLRSPQAQVHMTGQYGTLPVQPLQIMCDGAFESDRVYSRPSPPQSCTDKAVPGRLLAMARLPLPMVLQDLTCSQVRSRSKLGRMTLKYQVLPGPHSDRWSFASAPK